MPQEVRAVPDKDIKQPNSAQTAELSLALCLSGGGFRATFFHLGVIEALRNCKLNGKSLLEQVSDIYSVSGGSILSAHLIKNWAAYCGDDKAFAQISKQLCKFGSRNVRGRVLRRWLLSCVYLLPRWLFGLRRTFWLEQEYKHLLGQAPLSDYYKTNEDSFIPDIHILATSFNTGGQCSFTRYGFEIEDDDKTVRAIADRLPLAYAVTASSAFPPLFPPVKLTKDMLGDPPESIFNNSIYLSDGGIYDNLGFSKFKEIQQSAAKPASKVLVCDAGGSLKGKFSASFQSIAARNIRASDVLMQRVADQTFSLIELQDIKEVLHVGIAETVEDGSSRQIQQRLKRIRTDLDSFSSEEIEMLIAHGYRVCAKQVKDLGAICPERAVLYNDQDRLDEIAKQAEKRKLSFWNWSDFTSFFFAFTAACLIAVIASVITLSIQSSQAKKDRIEAEIIAKKSVSELVDEKGNSGTFEEGVKVLKAEIARLNKENAELKAQLPSDPNSDSKNQDVIVRTGYRVWLQFAGFERETMIKLGTQLNALWPKLPGADRGGERTRDAAGLNLVRYGPDEDKRAAQKLVRDIAKTKIVNAGTKVEQNDLIQPGTLEIWISR